MADKHHDSEQDTVYIASLLSKLRQSLGENARSESEHAEPASESATPSEEEVVLESAAVENEEEPTTAPSHDVPLDETMGKEASAAPVDTAYETTTERDASPQKNVEADPSPCAASVLHDEGEPSSPAPSASVASSYARTVLPGDPLVSGRNTRGRFLDYIVDDVDASCVSDGRSSATAGSALTDETASDTLQWEFDAGADLTATESDTALTMPIPDAPPSEIICHEGASASDPASSGQELPVSIWDTLPPIPTSEPETREISVEEEREMPAAERTTCTAAPSAGDGLFGRRARRTWADCEFDADPVRSVLTDKLLSPSQDLTPEDTAERQHTLWRQELRKKRFWMRVRTIAVGVCLLLAVLVELIPPFLHTLLSRLLLTRVPGATHLIDLQILLLAALFGAPQLYRGLAAIRFRRVIPETVLDIGVFVSIAACIYLTVADTTGVYFCALPAVLMIFASLIGDSFRLRSMTRAFDAYTAKGHHFCAVYTNVGEHPLLHEEFRACKNPNLFETASASRIDRFVDASRRRVECRRATWITLLISCFAALVTLVLSLLLHRGGAATAWSIVLSMLASMPPTLFGVHRFFFAMLSARVAEERVGIADEMTVFDYAHTGVMTFEDTEAFPAGSVKLSGIKLCGDFRLDKALYLMASVFDIVGGPLNGVFRVSTADINISDDVDIRTLYEDGIDARVNHDDVLIGTKAFLEARGVSVFRDVEDERADCGAAGILYLAYMGVLSAKFHLHYQMSDVFESNVEYYAKHGVASAILTADPLLSRAFLDRVSYVSEYDVRVVKKKRETLADEEQTVRAATLITYGPRKTLRRMPFFFGTYAKYQGIAVALMIILSALSALVLPPLLCLSSATVPWLAFLTQGITMVPCVVLGLLILRFNHNK